MASSSNAKVLLGLGGWTDSAGDKYSRMVSDAGARRKFVGEASAFLKRNGFHGLHIDWNYPKCWQSNCNLGPDSDKANFAALIQVRLTRLSYVYQVIKISERCLWLKQIRRWL